MALDKGVHRLAPAFTVLNCNDSRSDLFGSGYAGLGTVQKQREHVGSDRTVTHVATRKNILTRRHEGTERIKMTENEIGESVVDCAVKLHMRLGPGLLESVYETVLCYELQKRGLSVQRQVPIPITYDNMLFTEGFRADLIVDGKVILELKSVEQVTKAHKKQLLTYLRLSGRKVGYLLNFGEALMKDGISRIISGCLE
jgi:GxxExxY protein